MSKFLFPILLFVSFQLLGDTHTDSSKVRLNHKLGYDFRNPDAEFIMPSGLDEISGLSMSQDKSQLLANNDEEGKIFIVNKSTGAVESEIEFYKEGDYEGLEVVGESIFVVKSTGTIYEIKNLGKPEQEVIKHKFFLSKENDVEGLALDIKNNRLLLSCKGIGGVGDEFRMAKSVYAFDLPSRTLEEKPAIKIQAEHCHHYLGVCETHDNLEKLKAFFAAEDEFNLSPSAIAIHPISGEIFIASSRGKVLLVLDADGKILHIEKLDKKIHPQPEGLCFDSDGTLYMSNEKKKDNPAKIYKFNYRN
jgi:uncharacterized protein YjiK